MQPLRATDPTRVGRYVLSARLGAGGMGEVFYGRSPGGRPVAVKVIHTALAADPEFRRRFRLEVEANRRVAGIHTTPVVDADADADPPWMVTGYVPAPSLAHVLAERGMLPAHTVRALGAGLAEALEAIHAAGVVHRDLKPSNVLLAEDGPRVIDFGIARAADASGVTQRAGTPGFMAPEILTGSRPPSAASDVFALGVILAHASGTKPFGDGPAEAVQFRIVNQEPGLSGLDPELGALVAACLAKDPDDRPETGRLLDALAAPAGDSRWLPPDVHTLIDEARPPAPYPARPVPGVPESHGAPSWPAPPPTRGRGMATAALVLGPLGLLTCGLTSIVGVVLGHVSYARAGRAGGAGRGLALTGTIVAWSFTVLWLVVGLAVSANAESAARFVNALFS